MSQLNSHFSSETMPCYNVVTPEYSPSTAIAIALSKFDKEAKNQAEAEYDQEHGPLPDRPDPIDPSLDIAERECLKKKRKVRSAIVSRRKSALYVERVEADLKMRDNINVELRSHIDISREVLRNTTQRIQALEDVLERRRHSPKRARGPVESREDVQFFREETTLFEHTPSTTIDDILSISPDDFSQTQNLTNQASGEQQLGEALSEEDFESECSDKHSQLSLHAQVPYESGMGMQKSMFKNDSSWKGYLVPQQPISTRAI